MGSKTEARLAVGCMCLGRRPSVMSCCKLFRVLCRYHEEVDYSFGVLVLKISIYGWSILSSHVAGFSFSLQNVKMVKISISVMFRGTQTPFVSYVG